MQNPEYGRSIPLPKVLRNYWIVTLLLSIIALGTKLIIIRWSSLPAPYRFFIFPRYLLFIDLRCFESRFQFFHTPHFFLRTPAQGLIFMYPAPAALLYQFFYLFRSYNHYSKLYLAIVTIAIALVAAAFYKTLLEHKVSKLSATAFITVSVACSYPLMVNTFLANMEIFIGLLIGVGFYCFLTGRYMWAATCFGIATSIKIFPFIFIALFLGKKQYKIMAYFIALAAVITVFSLWLVSGSVVDSWHGIQDGLAFFADAYTLDQHPMAIAIDHSLFALFTGSFDMFRIHYPTKPTLQAVMHWYLRLTAVSGIALYFLRIRLLPVLNQILCFCTIAILFTPASHDYTIMHLYVPFGMLALLTIDATQRGVKIPGLTPLFVLFLIAFVPTNEFIVHANQINGQIKALALIGILYVALKHPFVAPEQPSIYAPA